MKKLFISLLFLFGTLSIGTAYAQLGGGSGTIGQLDQFKSTSTPISAITQTVTSRPVVLTGYSSGCATFTATGTLQSTGVACGSGSGSVTSVAATVPTGLSISGSPITTSGSLDITLTPGYNIPLTASTTEWSTLISNPVWRLGNGFIYNATSTDKIGIGTSTPLATLHLSDGNAASSTWVSADTLFISKQGSAAGFNIGVAHSSASSRGVFKGTRSRGTLADPTAVAINDLSFSLLGNVFDGTVFRATAGIDFIVDTTPVANTSAGQGIVFNTGTTARAEKMRITSGGLIGIGTTTPGSKLDVWGNLNVGTSSTPLLFANTATGNVGIGTSSPIVNLDIYGAAGASDIFAISSSTNTRLFTVTAAGNVGVGTSTPTTLFSVAGNILNTGSAVFAGDNFTIQDSSGNVRFSESGGTVAFGANGGSTNVSGYAGPARFNIGSLSAASIPLAITGVAAQTGDLFRADTTGSTGAQFIIKSNGNVGVSTTTPSNTVDIWGGLNVGTTSSPLIYASSTRNVLTVNNPITVIPNGTKFIVDQNTSATTLDTNSLLMVNNSSATTNNLSGIGFSQIMTNNSATFLGSAISAIHSNRSGGSRASALAFYTMTGQAAAEKMRLTETGQLAIGTTTATEVLEVNGNIRFLATNTGQGIFGKNSSGTHLFSLTRQGTDLSISSFNGIGLAPNQTAGAGASTTFALYVNSSSNVGIGTTTPNARLDLYGAAGATSIFRAASSTNVIQFEVDAKGHQYYGGSAPGISSCGTSPSFIEGNDNAGRVQVGSVVATSCQIDFATAWDKAPICDANVEGGLTVFTSASSTKTAVVITGASALTGDIITYQCKGVR